MRGREIFDLRSDAFAAFAVRAEPAAAAQICELPSQHTRCAPPRRARHRARRSPSATPRRSGGAASRGRRTRGKPCSRGSAAYPTGWTPRRWPATSSRPNSARRAARGGRAAGRARTASPTRTRTSTSRRTPSCSRRRSSRCWPSCGRTWRRSTGRAARSTRPSSTGPRRATRRGCARRPTRRTAAAPRCSARSASAARCSTPPTAGWCATAAPPATARSGCGPRATPRPSSSFASGWRRSSRSTASPVAGARAAGCRRSSRRRAASSCRARRAGRTWKVV